MRPGSAAIGRETTLATTSSGGAGYGAFRQGYWDYPLAQRGVLFAPVRFVGNVYLQPRFVYSPSYVIDPLDLTFSR